MESCKKCGGLDSHIDLYYLDHNNDYRSQTEVEEYIQLHPGANIDEIFKKVFLCGMCSFDIKYSLKV